MSKPPKDHFSKKRLPVFSPLYFTIFPTTTAHFPPACFRLSGARLPSPPKRAPPRVTPRPREMLSPASPRGLSPWRNLSPRGTVSKLPLVQAGKSAGRNPCPCRCSSATSSLCATCQLRASALRPPRPPLRSTRGRKGGGRARGESPGSCGTCWPSSGLCTPQTQQQAHERRASGASLEKMGPGPCSHCKRGSFHPWALLPLAVHRRREPRASLLSTAHAPFSDAYSHTGLLVLFSTSSTSAGGRSHFVAECWTHVGSGDLQKGGEGRRAARGKTRTPGRGAAFAGCG